MTQYLFQRLSPDGEPLGHPVVVQCERWVDGRDLAALTLGRDYLTFAEDSGAWADHEIRWQGTAARASDMLYKEFRTSNHEGSWGPWQRM